MPAFDRIGDCQITATKKRVTFRGILLKNTAGRASSGTRVAALSLLILTFVARPLTAEDWPQFRGPNCSGISNSDKPLPVKFSASENIAWSAEVGHGIGSPIVADGRVYTSAMVGDERVALICFAVADGSELWRREWDTGTLAEIHEANSHAATTPAVDSERVYFYFSTLGMIAVDAKTGEDAWQRELPVPYFVFKWGPGMSPVLFDDMVIFCQDDDLYPAMYALDKQTGKIRWQVGRSEMAVNYSHPVICETDSGPELVVAGTGKLIGYDPHTGKVKWYARTLLRNIKTTPVSHDGVVYVSLQSGGIANQWLTTADSNKDSKLTKAEMQEFVGEVKIPETFFAKFDRGDVNKDGFLVGEELDLAFLDSDNFAGARFDAADASSQFIMAIRGGGSGDVTDTHLIWKHPSRAPDHIVSPLVVDGRMLLVKGGGIASSFDIAKGKKVLKERRINNVGEYFASPIYGDGKIYVAGENGKIVVLENGPKLNVLAKNDIGESCLATPAIADGHLFVRTLTKLYCVGKTAN